MYLIIYKLCVIILALPFHDFQVNMITMRCCFACYINVYLDTTTPIYLTTILQIVHRICCNILLPWTSWRTSTRQEWKHELCVWSWASESSSVVKWPPQYYFVLSIRQQIYSIPTGPECPLSMLLSKVSHAAYAYDDPYGNSSSPKSVTPL